jgi:hypothetical protein
MGSLGFFRNGGGVSFRAVYFMGLSEHIQYGMRRVSGLFAFPEHNTSGIPDLGTSCFWKRDEAGKASKFDVIVMCMLGFHLLFFFSRIRQKGKSMLSAFFSHTISIYPQEFSPLHSSPLIITQRIHYYISR